jgi:hypothetical protein
MFIGCIENSWEEVCLNQDSVLSEYPVAVRCGLSLLYMDSFNNKETNEKNVFLLCTDIICLELHALLISKACFLLNIACLFT